jgi:hypothetical protein
MPLMHWIVPGVIFALLLTYTFAQRQAVRIGAIVLAIFAPPGYGVLTVQSMALAPYFTGLAFFGNQDGEFYSEGFLIWAAMGWWAILWLALAIREIVNWIRKPRPISIA